MKVKELIEELSKMDPERLVVQLDMITLISMILFIPTLEGVLER